MAGNPPVVEWVDCEDCIRAIKICAKIIVDWSQ